MAKKPPKQPDPPFDDFDPDQVLGEEIAPIDDDAIIHGDLVEDDAATQLDLGAVDEPLPEIVEADEFAEVVDVEPDGSTQLVVDGDEPMLDVEVEEVVAVVGDDAAAEVEVAADDLTEEINVDDAILEGTDEVVAADELVDAPFDDAASPHDAETVGTIAALEGDDPFVGVGGEEVAEVGEESELVGTAVGEDDDGPYEVEIPKPKLHWFTWTLIGLNIVAILAMPYLVVMTLQKRQQYNYAVFQHDLAMLGLPNEDEERPNLTAARITLPGYRIPAEEIKKIYSQRSGVMPVGDKFETVEEQIVRRIPPSMLNKEILRDHFGEWYVDSGAGGEPITTVEAEVRRLAKNVAPDMEKAAQESFAALPSEDAKRNKIIKLLHPLAMDGYQSEELDKMIKSAKGPELEKLFMDAAQRRMAFDFLLPMEFFRPGDAKSLFVERIGNLTDRKPPEGIAGEKLKTLEALPLSEVMDRVTQRLESTIGDKYQPAIHIGEEYGSLKRDTIEKRLTIAFTLLSLGHVRKPDGELLFPKLVDRLPYVVGQYDFALAAELFPRRLLTLNEQVLERIKIDREGFEIPNPEKKDELLRNKAFIDYYEDELQRIRFLQNDIFKAKIRLDDLKDQKARYETLLAERTKQRADVLDRIAKARAKSAEEAAKLHIFENDLHKNQVELSSSEETLERLDRAIRQNQRPKDGPKGDQP